MSSLKGVAGRMRNERSSATNFKGGRSLVLMMQDIIKETIASYHEHIEQGMNTALKKHGIDPTDCRIEVSANGMNWLWHGSDVLFIWSEPNLHNDNGQMTYSWRFWPGSKSPTERKDHER